MVPEQASQTFEAAAGLEGPPGATAIYRVEVERGLPIAVGDFATLVTQTLTDERSWAAGGHRLQRVAGAADFRVVLAAPETADALCAPLDTGGRLSCRNGADVVINAWRWVNGTTGYERRLRAYQRYVVNHEVGHALGYPHVACPAPGVPRAGHAAADQGPRRLSAEPLACCSRPAGVILSPADAARRQPR